MHFLHHFHETLQVKFDFVFKDIIPTFIRPRLLNLVLFIL